MFTNNKYIKKTYIILIVAILLSIDMVCLAENDLKDMNNKIDEQNEKLYKKILENTKNESNILEQMIKESDRKNTGSTREINLGNIASGIQKGSILLAIKARKYVVPVTMLILLFNIFMLSATGAKNIKNRKKYIYSSVFFYMFFLIVLNFPLYLLWRSSIGAGDIFNLNKLFELVEGISKFLKDNSFVFSVIIFAFGLVNKISSESNLPKRLASEYMIKMSFILFALFNLMPYILKLAV